MKLHHQPIDGVSSRVVPGYALAKLRALALAALLCLAALVPRPSHAVDVTSNFNVTATVLAVCLVSASNVAFGNYSGAQSDATGTVTATCTSGTTYTVALSAGAGSGATVGARLMNHSSTAGQTLGYTLYRNAGRTQVWGTTTGTDTVAGTGNGSAQALTVYGRVPAAQYPEAGSYSDTVTATLTY